MNKNKLITPTEDLKCSKYILNENRIFSWVYNFHKLNHLFWSIISFLRFGGSTVKKMEQEAEKRKLAEKKAAIGYNYDGETSADQGGLFRNVEEKENPEEADAEGQGDSEEEFDLDIVFDVDQIPTEQAREMNLLSGTYGNLLLMDSDGIIMNISAFML